MIGNLVHSSAIIKRRVLEEGALQPVINLLSSSCTDSQREAALLLGQFATGAQRVAEATGWGASHHLHGGCRKACHRYRPSLLALRACLRAALPLCCVSLAASFVHPACLLWPSCLATTHCACLPHCPCTPAHLQPLQPRATTSTR